MHFGLSNTHIVMFYVLFNLHDHLKVIEITTITLVVKSQDHLTIIYDVEKSDDVIVLPLLHTIIKFYILGYTVLI